MRRTVASQICRRYRGGTSPHSRLQRTNSCSEHYEMLTQVTVDRQHRTQRARERQRVKTQRWPLTVAWMIVFSRAFTFQRPPSLVRTMRPRVSSPVVGTPARLISKVSQQTFASATSRPDKPEFLDFMASRVIVKRTSGTMKPGDHFREFLTTRYPTPACIDENRILDTLVGGHRRSRLVTVPVFLETVDQYRSNISLVLLTVKLHGMHCTRSARRQSRPRNLQHHVACLRAHDVGGALNRDVGFKGPHWTRRLHPSPSR